MINLTNTLFRHKNVFKRNKKKTQKINNYINAQRPMQTKYLLDRCLKQSLTWPRPTSLTHIFFCI